VDCSAAGFNTRCLGLTSYTPQLLGLCILDASA